MTTYVVREAVVGGEYLRADGTRTPASDEAVEFETYEGAAASLDRGVDAVYARTEDGPDRRVNGPVDD